jgi:phosphoglycerate kinase
MKYLSKAKIQNSTVLLRTSLDLPLELESGKVTDDFRLQAALPTLRYLKEQGNRIIICGKLGRPGGKVDQKLSLRPVAECLAKLLDMTFAVSDFKLPTDGLPHVLFYKGDLEDEKCRKQLQNVPLGDIVVLENLEFYARELDNSPVFGKHLSLLAEVYVNDDFAKCHHLVASIGTITKYLPSYAGLQLEKEIAGLSRIVKSPKSPFVIMMGGIKITDKAKTLEYLGKKADNILLAGGLANLFFKAKGFEIGKSKIELEAKQQAWQMEKNFKNKLILPVDVVVAKESMDKSTIRCCLPQDVGKSELILDVGPKTMLAYAKVLKGAKTVVWNGPLGHFEVKPFHHGTMALAKVVGGVGQGKAFTVVGGGETVDAVRIAGQENMIDLLSTGGGAMLEFLSGVKLPGIEALN